MHAYLVRYLVIGLYEVPVWPAYMFFWYPVRYLCMPILYFVFCCYLEFQSCLCMHAFLVVRFMWSSSGGLYTMFICDFDFYGVPVTACVHSHICLGPCIRKGFSCVVWCKGRAKRYLNV